MIDIKKQEIVSLMEEMENGMVKTELTKDIWQNKLIYSLCCAVYYLLKDKLKESKENDMS